MLKNGIPISISLSPTLQREHVTSKKKYNKQRTLRLSLLAVLIAICISFIAKFLIHLIDLITNISFYGNISLEASSPSHNSLGLWVIIVPAIGGLIVGLMALYGSKAIRGHGIPEAMEQILTNQSKIKPSITYLKPLSSAITIGTGGPFGAEGPIIATGGALGSTFGQLINITPNERKILLAAGATAGMSAIFSSPVAAILLAIELLLFEFSARSFIPVALACITGAAGHHLLFGAEVVFPLSSAISAPSNYALFFYSIMGIAIGLLSVVVTKLVYWLEDVFEKLPIHWAWWPAIGGIAVGIVGYFSPRTLGVGYNNIIDLLSGSMSIQIVASLCILKFVSWAISLSSGTSGGTLAPLLTIGGAIGVLIGSIGMYWFPNAGINLPLAALVGMSALFAGASRAFLTSIVFALETTGQSNALLPLLATCTTSYFTSFFLMENTIMTEKIARRGIATPESYEPDILEKTTVEQIETDSGMVINDEMEIGEVRSWLLNETDLHANYFIVADNEGIYKGILSSSNLNNAHHKATNMVTSIVKRNNVYIQPSESLKKAVEIMAKENIDILPVVLGKKIVGILTYQHIISIYKTGIDEQEKKQTHISLHRQRLKLLVHGQKLVSFLKIKK
ncbi:MAG: chloride channel protein [Chitinophagaceae bacterium]|nr:chloride channel protein [Chitinophagaceae bacterium]MCW5906019.1 chloride channel protein [Chitinophagaceae bacterium]